jgi:hypothetical protein
VQRPVVLIEFDHQNPANLRLFTANPTIPEREHVHTVLSQHCEKRPHPHSH